MSEDENVAFDNLVHVANMQANRIDKLQAINERHVRRIRELEESLAARELFICEAVDLQAFGNQAE